MFKPDIDLLARTRRPLPKNASSADMLYYYAVRGLYKDYDDQLIEADDAGKHKREITAAVDTLQGLAHSNSKIIIELSKLTAPRRELPKKSKAELLEIINRIEAIVAGLMTEYDGKLPEFMKIKEEENESV